MSSSASGRRRSCKRPRRPPTGSTPARSDREGKRETLRQSEIVTSALAWLRAFAGPIVDSYSKSTRSRLHQSSSGLGEHSPLNEFSATLGELIGVIDVPQRKPLGFLDVFQRNGRFAEARSP